jgi:hypothetical protein
LVDFVSLITRVSTASRDHQNAPARFSTVVSAAAAGSVVTLGTLKRVDWWVGTAVKRSQAASTPLVRVESPS